MHFLSIYLQRHSTADLRHYVTVSLQLKKNTVASCVIAYNLTQVILFIQGEVHCWDNAVDKMIFMFIV